MQETWNISGSQLRVVRFSSSSAGATRSEERPRRKADDSMASAVEGSDGECVTCIQVLLVLASPLLPLVHAATRPEQEDREQ